jgi:hypothetical protein
MSSNLLQVINTQSLQKIRLAVLANPDIVEMKFDDLGVICYRLSIRKVCRSLGLLF